MLHQHNIEIVDDDLAHEENGRLYAFAERLWQAGLGIGIQVAPRTPEEICDHDRSTMAPITPPTPYPNRIRMIAPASFTTTSRTKLLAKWGKSYIPRIRPRRRRAEYKKSCPPQAAECNC